ncbi:MAG: glycosyltransferase family 4 protein [Thermoleophilia bacterium]
MHIRRAFEIPRGSNTNIRIFLNYVSFPLASLSHIPRLLTKKYDKIFLYQLSPVMMSLAGIIVGRVKKVETTMYVLDLWPENLYSVIEVKNRFLRSLAKRVSHWHYRNVDKIAAISQKMKEQMHEITGLPDEKIIFVPQCCEKLYERDIHDGELSQKFGSGFNIVFAGNISPAQSFETVIAAAKQLKRDGIDDINWIIVGDGMSRKWLEDKVTAAGLKDNFFFEGFRPVADIPKYHTMADALLACLVKSDLLDCTIPAKVMSYLAAGRPLLLAMDGEAQRLVNEIGCGFAGDSDDGAALYENIKNLYNLPKEQRESMGKKGREYHFKYFERDMNLNRLYSFIFDQG